MKAINFLEYIRGTLTLKRIAPIPNPEIKTDEEFRAKVFSLSDFYNQPFKPEMITELFEGWDSISEWAYIFKGRNAEIIFYTQLANENRNYTEIENDKKSVTADFGARLAESKAKIDRLANNINSGYELRRVNVEIRMHDPAEGKKTVVRTDTNTVVEVLNMSEEELQEELDFDKAEKKTAEAEIVDSE